MGESNKSRIGSIGEAALTRMEAVNQARERALAETRQIIRLSANAIRAVHRGDYPDAEDLLVEARTLKDALVEYLEDQPKIYWSGYVQDAQKEYSEARITLAVIAGLDLPGPVELAVDDAVYLNGLGEAAGELRRHVLDTIRRDDLESAEQVLAVMEDIYGLLVTVDYPDAVTNGLRRTTDMVRGVLERTRGDLTMSRQQRDLTRALERAERVLKSDGPVS